MTKLNIILRTHKIGQLEISKLLKIKSRSTINLKINGKSNFTTEEAKLIKQYINEKTNSNYTIEDLF